jgi:hypothetical protein
MVVPDKSTSSSVCVVGGGGVAGWGLVVVDGSGDIWRSGLRTRERDQAHLEGEDENAVSGSTRDSKRWVEERKTSSPLRVGGLTCVSEEGEWESVVWNVQMAEHGRWRAFRFIVFGFRANVGESI